MSADKELKSFIDRVLRMKEEQDAISADIRDIYAEAKMHGYDKTAMGKVVAYLRKIEKAGPDAASEQEMIFDTYLAAYQNGSGTSFATHTHEAARKPIDVNPRLAKQIVDGMQTEAGRAALLTAVDILIEQDEENTPSDARPASVPTVTRPPGDSEGEAEGIASSLPVNSPETATKSTAARMDVPHPHQTQGARTVILQEDSKDRSADKVQAGTQALSVDNHSPSDDDAISEVNGEAGLENATGVEPSSSDLRSKAMDELLAASAEELWPAESLSAGNAAANAGGDHVTDPVIPDTEGPGLVNQPRATPLRPFCLKPENCGGYGDKTCHSCLVAARKSGEAA